MKTYTIIGGVNGTGKSSLTGVLKTKKTDLCRIIDVDKITAQNGGSAIQGGKIALELLARNHKMLKIMAVYPAFCGCIFETMWV